MVARLLDRQISLLEYLTSSGAIFGADGAACPDQALHGFDHGLLRLEACFSHEKRMEKIQAVFPLTFRLLADARAEIVRDFTEACPPIDISRIENARQFHDFLCTRWRRRSPEPPYLRDVAACEFSIAKARVNSDADGLVPHGGDRAPCGSIRRHPGAVLLRCEYDVRPIFEPGAGDAVPRKRDTPLAFQIPPGAQHPKIFQLLPGVFDVLRLLDAWTARSELPSIAGLDELIDDLADHGLIEVHP